MPPDHVIRHRRVEADEWKIVEEDAGVLPAGRIVVPLAVWQSWHGELLAGGRVGAWLDPHEDPEALRDDLPWLPLIAVRFPKLADGRGYSIAALLRRRGFRGELRAFGDIGRDQLLFLERSGFDAFRLPPDRDPEAALAAFGELSVNYQGAANDPVPLFRRRMRAAREDS